jgi:hypothetical protein
MYYVIVRQTRRAVRLCASELVVRITVPKREAPLESGLICPGNSSNIHERTSNSAHTGQLLERRFPQEKVLQKVLSDTSLLRSSDFIDNRDTKPLPQ